MNRIFIGIIAMALAACGPVGTAFEQPARETAKVVIRPIVAAQFPGVPTDVVVDCTIDNATSDEVIALASSAVTGDTTSATQVTLGILSRPTTQNCLINHSGLLGGFLGGLG